MKKKSKRVGYAALGVSITGQALRFQAAKRAEEFAKGALPYLSQVSRAFEEGVGFWDRHKRMLGDKFSSSDWKTAKEEQEEALT